MYSQSSSMYYAGKLPVSIIDCGKFWIFEAAKLCLINSLINHWILQLFEASGINVLI